MFSKTQSVARATIACQSSVLRPRHTMRQMLRHVAATSCCNKSPSVTCENHCSRCDRISSLRSVAQIQTGLNLCDISQRQTKRKRLVAAAVQTRQLVAAICRIVCLGFKSRVQSDESNPWKKRKPLQHLKRISNT